MSPPTVLSCIQPTGDIHLGNYLGAVRRWVADQSPSSYHGVVDLHALTIPQEPGSLREKTRQTAMILLAAGIDPHQTTLFVQSMIHEHCELSWILECTISYGELLRMTQFKDKVARSKTSSVSTGLLTYPALMAADILLYDTEFVPVGDDQRQHLELARDAAQRFNSRFGPIFVIPNAAIPTSGARIMDLQDPSAKMSKSASSPNGAILVLDTPDVIRRKFRRAVTDGQTGVNYEPDSRPGVSNLLDILSACTGEAVHAVSERIPSCAKLKEEVADATISVLQPMQESYRQLAQDADKVYEILAQGSAKAQLVARTTLRRVKDAIGLWS